MCSQEALLDLENEKYVVCLSLIWEGLSSSLPLPLSYLGVSAHREQASAAQPGASLKITETGKCAFHIIKDPHHFMF